jgi:3-oxoacyl-[acyl-carrier protein] reductase
MDLGLDGRVAVVTGASRGIGAATARLLADEGASLVLGSRGAEGLDAVAAGLRAAGAEVITVAGDVADPATTLSLVGAAVDRYGRLDVVVNNAGGESGNRGFEQLSDQDWELVYRLNVTSAVRLATAAVPVMRERGWGRIVNVSSYTARVPEPFCPAYSAAKAALVNVTRNQSRAFAADGILASCVLPGLTATEGVTEGFAAAVDQTGRTQDDLLAAMLRRAPIDVGRMGQADEVAAAIVFLASERASWITGASLLVDGGTVRAV